MALTSVFYDGPVTETDWAKNRGSEPDYGVYGINDFKVTAHPSIPYAVLVKAGKAHGFGVTDTAGADQVVNCESLASGVRWDLIVVRRNWQPAAGGPSTLVAIQVGANPIIPDAPIRKIGPGVEDDQPLFLVKWQGGVSAPVQFIDLRCWTGNGGLYATNDMARTYLNKVGTEININGVVWAYQIGDNDIAGWVKISAIGSIPIFGAGSGRLGGIPPAGTSFLVQSGTSVSSSDKAGYGAIDFPKPFPNGVLYVKADSGDASIDYARGTALTYPTAGAPDWPNAVTLTRFVYAVQRSNGTRIPEALHRADWIAVGW